MNTWLQDAAERAVRYEGIDAVILFGSRARGDAGRHGDWDLCVVGSRRPESIDAALGLADCRYESGRVDLVWQDRQALREQTSAGSLWADIVRDGRVLAGDSEILRGIEIKPMKKSQIVGAFAWATKKIETAVHHAREATTSSSRRRALAEIEGTEASGFAAEQLSRGLLGLLGEQPGGGHKFNTNAEILRRGAEGATDPGQACVMRAVADAIERTNGGTHDARGATYDGHPKERERWEEHIAEVARLYTEVIKGIMTSTGTLAGLHEIKQADRAREIIANEAAAGRETSVAIDAAGIRHLKIDTKRALKAWEKQWSAVVALHLGTDRQPGQNPPCAGADGFGF